MIGNQKISVVVATYNGERFIEEQINSIINQSLQPDEIIICDDNSNDLTVEKTKKTIEKSEIEYKIILHKKNQGVVKNFFEGASSASGEYIFLCDQDDYWLPQKIEHMSKILFDDKKVQLVFSDATIVDENLNKRNTSLWETIFFKPSRVKSYQDYFNELLRRNIFTGMCMAVRKSLINLITDYPDFMLHDELIGWYALNRGSVYPLQERLVLYRQHSMNVVGVDRHKKIASISETKKMINKSSTRTYKKIEYLINKKLFMNGEIDSMRVMEFYDFRSKILEEKKLPSLFRSFRHLIKGNYSKYTSKTEKAFIKDVFCIL